MVCVSDCVAGSSRLPLSASLLCSAALCDAQLTAQDKIDALKEHNAWRAEVCQLLRRERERDEREATVLAALHNKRYHDGEGMGKRQIQREGGERTRE